MLVIGLSIWVVFTPERLTPIVRNIASQYVKSEHTIEKVELTFFSTFPHFGVEIDNVVVINPMEGAPSDTVVAVPKMLVGLDVMALIKHQTLSIPVLEVPDVQANLFVNAEGVANYDVLVLPTDSVAEEDTTAMSLPFEHIKVDRLVLSASEMRYHSMPDTMDVAVQDAKIVARVTDWRDMQLVVGIERIDMGMAGEKLVDGLSLHGTLPAAVDMDNMRVSLHGASVSANNLQVGLDGWAEMSDALQTNMRITLHEWKVDDVVALLPISLDRDVANLVAGGTVSLDVTAAIDMGNGEESKLLIHEAQAHLKHTELAVQGEVKDPMGKLWMDISADMDVLMADVKSFLPAGMCVEGRVKGDTKVKMYLDDLTEMQLHKGQIAGDIQLLGVQYQADSMEATLPNNRLQFHIPNPAPSRKEVDWIAATLKTDGGSVNMQPTLWAGVGEAQLSIEANNILGESPYLYATLAVECSEELHAVMDSVDVTVVQPSMQTYVAYHMTDTNVMPVVDAAIAFQRVYGNYTDVELDMQASTLSAMLRAPRLQANVQTKGMMAKMDDEIHLETQDVALSAAARYNAKGGENLLLKWNPKLFVDIHGAEVALADWDQTIQIPEIDFSYTNRDCQINKSTIIIGNSDFSLTGEVRNIGRWMRNKAILEGELYFDSDRTDVNELLALVSADQGSEEEVEETFDAPTADESSETISEPFLVPTNVDITLNTKIKKAEVFNQTARNLGGRVYVKDGILVVEEMGFVCNAAKLQLTGMYRTPRRNHIYVGFDYHMLDVNIEELIGMIPQLDSMMPMLRSFKGEAEFHLAAETYTNASYEIKPSTLRGAASLYGKDLVVLDNETFSKISKLLMFSKKTENKVDSISAELTLYKKEIDVYPFCVSMDNYMVAMGGQHNLDMTFNYDINVLSPIYLGVNISGDLEDLDIKLAPCKFAKDFKPLFHRKVDTQSAELRAMIRESMRKNVKE